MDFSKITDPRYAAFRAEVEEFVAEQMTPELRAAVRQTSDRHYPAFFRALGDRGWVIPERAPELGGAGLDDVESAILNNVLMRVEAPILPVSATRLAFPAVDKYATDAVKAEVLPRVLRGEVPLILGYTEPSGGSDIAHVLTRATRSGDKWIISGAKMFSSNAHLGGYSFLLTKTNPDAPKRKNLTMFLVPLDLPGVTVAPMWTLGERTNIVYFADVELDDRYRLGEVDGGWTVLSGPLAAEHSLRDRAAEHPAIGRQWSRGLTQALEVAIDWALDGDRADDPAIRAAIAEVAKLAAAAMATDELTGRVVNGENLIRGMNILMDIMAPDSLFVGDSAGGFIESNHNLAQVGTIYGGTVEVFRNMIARQLGLPNPHQK